MNLEVISQQAEGATRPSPILFVHGFWHGAWCWAGHFLPAFARQGYDCYALSLRGHGRSEGTKRLRWHALAGYTADVIQVAETLDRPPILVGHSMGGLIVQKVLQRHAAPAAVLLASVPPTGLLFTTLRYLTRHPVATGKAILTLSVYHLVSTPELYRSAFLSPAFPEDELRQVHAQVQDDSFRAFLDMLLLDLPRPRKVLPTPMLVLGADDFIVRAGEVEGTARAYGVEATIFAGMGHAMMLDEGWQAVAERILSWLDQQGL